MKPRARRVMHIPRPAGYVFCACMLLACSLAACQGAEQIDDEILTDGDGFAGDTGGESDGDGGFEQDGADDFPDGDQPDGGSGDDAADAGHDGGTDGGSGDETADAGPDGADELVVVRDPALAGDLSWTESEAEVGIDTVDIPLSIYLPEGAGPFPVVVFHHGFQLAPDLYTSYGEHLASWGYVVVFPAMPGGLFDSPNHRELKEYLLAILDWLDDNAADQQGPLGGKADMSILGLAGHSMGGKIALLAASEDDRPLGVFGVDPVDAAGGPMNTVGPDYPSVTPELMDQITVPLGLLGETVNATCEGFMCQACAPEEDNFQQYYLHAVSPVLEIEVIGANHMSFLDNPDCGMTCSACPKGTDDPETTRMLTRRYLTAFLQVVLRSENAYFHYLTGPGMEADEDAGLVVSQSKNGF